ncbi:MAG: AI-2E family transporter, partial [Rhodothermaceae bacterium]
MSITDQTLKTIGKYLVISSAVAGGLYLCYFFIDIILILILSILLGMIINPLVNILERRGIGRLFSVVIVFLLLGVIFILGMSFFIPMIISQMNTIAGTLTQENVSQVLVQIGDGIKNYIPFLDSSKLTEQLSTGISNILFNSFDDVSNLVSEIFSVLSISVIIPFITFFLVKDHTQISKGLISMIPNRYFEMSYSVLKKINYQLGKYV